jgi:hypothetical protein
MRPAKASFDCDRFRSGPPAQREVDRQFLRRDELQSDVLEGGEIAEGGV